MQPIVENAVNTPAFLGKLWKMVNDPSTDHLISWGPAGNTFVIQNQAQFWYELLPLYYKHNNMSSFVRQLNMYGFHKISTVENGTMDADKDEIQFTHPFFQKDQPELLRMIKRKATTSKSSLESGGRHDDLSKVLTDVKLLRGRQVSVDNQLNAMKQENALLWREVAILRQKHMKQQKIVNKLIHFLITLVNPSRMPVGVKRGFQLMLHENPCKKSKVSNSKQHHNAEGPTIHELDNELDLSPNNMYEDDVPLIDSPVASTASQHSDLNSPLLLTDGNGDPIQTDSWDKPEFVNFDERTSPADMVDNEEINEENLINTLENNTLKAGAVNTQKIFLNPTTQDTLLSNLIKSNYTNGNSSKKSKTQPLVIKTEDLPQLINESSSSPVFNSNNMAIATRDKNSCDSFKSMPSTSDFYSEDLSNHVESTQSELEQFKDILNGYNSLVDANALLGLFHGDSPPQFTLNETENNGDKNESLLDTTDPLVSGSELAPYGNNFDFTELFDDSINGGEALTISTAVPVSDVPSSTVTTPQITRDELIFPSPAKK